MRTPHEYAAGLCTAANDDTPDDRLPRGVWVAVAVTIVAWLVLAGSVVSAVS